ncbi:MAG: hypothetical protein JW787_05260 [Sedimentisphaerales bacterium]|nr:hypothetical protein [Sedimentisphaerales bacterium]
MKYKIAVSNYSWENDFVSLEFILYKKGILGGLKPINKFEGWCLCFQLKSEDEIDIDSFMIQDGNFKNQPLNIDMVNGVLMAGSISLKEDGKEKEAGMLSSAARAFFKKCIS